MNEKIKEIFKDKFSRYAILQMLIAIVLFVILIIFLKNDLKDALKYLFSLKLNDECTTTGMEVVFHIKPIFYFLMFVGSALYTIYGIHTLIKYQNQRQVFKIIFRSIFYVSGIILFHYVIALIAFLVLPVTNWLGIYGLVFFIFIFEVAIGGRLASNFSVLNMTLKKRKLIAYITVSAFIFLCSVSIGMAFYETIEVESVIFYSFELISAVFALMAIYYYKDSNALAFEIEPEIITDKVYNVFDIDPNLTVLKVAEYQKNLKITKATLNKNIEIIPESCFANALRLEEVIIPVRVKEIGANAFFNTLSLKTITYEGTKEEFSKIKFGSNWLTKSQSKVINCLDGNIYLNN